MERVKEGEKYWFISELFTVEARYESNGIMDTELFKVNNYFPASDYTPKMVNEMAEKIRKVLKGAIVVDNLPSEETFEKYLNEQFPYIGGTSGLMCEAVKAEWRRCFHWIKSQLTKEE